MFQRILRFAIYCVKKLCFKEYQDLQFTVLKKWFSKEYQDLQFQDKVKKGEEQVGKQSMQASRHLKSYLEN